MRRRASAAPRSLAEALAYAATEASTQASIVAYLELRRIPCTVTDASRTWSRSGRPGRPRVSTPGWPDITAVLPGGRMLGIEVKSRRGRLRPAQRATLGLLAAAGAVVVVARSVRDVMTIVEPARQRRGSQAPPLPLLGRPGLAPRRGSPARRPTPPTRGGRISGGLRSARHLPHPQSAPRFGPIRYAIEGAPRAGGFAGWATASCPSSPNGAPRF